MKGQMDVATCDPMGSG